MADARDEDRTGDLMIQEVDEDLRRDQYLKLWKRYGVYLIGAAVALVVAVGGWQAWQGYQREQRDQAAQRYAAAVTLSDDGKSKDADAALAKIAADGGGFGVLAGMKRAQLLADSGDAKGAMAAYDQIATSGAPKLLKGLATIKEGLLALNGKDDSTAVEGRIAELTTAGNPWFYQASELVALFALKKGDAKRAAGLFKQLADDTQAPGGVRGRATEIVAALGELSPAPAPASPPPAEAKKDAGK